ncbi:hypothetical protein Mapa_007782 [Marchantia paleacea]|nr:hypothetical protein Mapa_007782 [Marchantia paleacea]
MSDFGWLGANPRRSRCTGGASLSSCPAPRAPTLGLGLSWETNGKSLAVSGLRKAMCFATREVSGCPGRGHPETSRIVTTTRRPNYVYSMVTSSLERRKNNRDVDTESILAEVQLDRLCRADYEGFLAAGEGRSE